MKKKKWLLFSSIGVLSTASMMTACSTSWNKWETKNGGDRSWSFTHDIAPAIQWKVRTHSKLLKAWDLKTNTLNISLLNNQFELFTLIGIITNIENPKMTQSINNYYKYALITNDQNYSSSSYLLNWKGLYDYMNDIKKQITINVVEKGKSYGSITLDLSMAIQKLINGMKKYNNNEIDYNKGKSKITNNWFHIDRQYDVEYNGLDQNNHPVDLLEVAKAAGNLTNNPTVKGLMAVNIPFAFELATLVNIPKTSFQGFVSFMTIINNFLDNFFQNKGFDNWIKDNNVNFKLTPKGRTPSAPPPLSTAFKGYFITTVLKK